MRPGLVEAVYIGAQYPLELLLMEDEQVIETLATHTPQKAFTSRSDVTRADHNASSLRVYRQRDQAVPV